MESRVSAVRTPLTKVVVHRRSKSYRQSYRSCVSATSHLGYTPRFSTRRLTTSRRVSKSHGIDKVDREQLAVLVKREWQLLYVTPLHQFMHTQLKTYSRQLSQFIVAEKQQGLAEGMGLAAGFKVSFSVVLGLAEVHDAETVLIQIHNKPMFAGPDEPPKLVWTGWLTCINGNPDFLSSLPKEFVCLPLFCSSGAQWLTSMVTSWFQQTFDCCFGPLELNSTSLEWLAALWTNCHSEFNTQSLKMVWTLPVVPPLDVTYTVHGEDAWALWRSVRLEEEEEEEEEEENAKGDGKAAMQSCVDMEEVTRFMVGLKGHFHRHFRMDLNAATLSQVSTALGSARHSGTIKISHSNYMITTLMLLTECALHKMPI